MNKNMAMLGDWCVNTQALLAQIRTSVALGLLVCYLVVNIGFHRIAVRRLAQDNPIIGVYTNLQIASGLYNDLAGWSSHSALKLGLLPWLHWHYGGIYTLGLQCPEE